MKQGKFKEAKENFQQAYDCLMQVRGIVNEDAITILNNISVACVNVNSYYVYYQLKSLSTLSLPVDG